MSDFDKMMENTFREKFRDFSPDPPAELWERVRSSISEVPSAAGNSVSSRTVSLHNSWFISAVAGIGGLVMVISNADNRIADQYNNQSSLLSATEHTIVYNDPADTRDDNISTYQYPTGSDENTNETEYQESPSPSEVLNNSGTATQNDEVLAANDLASRPENMNSISGNEDQFAEADILNANNTGNYKNHLQKMSIPGMLSKDAQNALALFEVSGLNMPPEYRTDYLANSLPGLNDLRFRDDYGKRANLSIGLSVTPGITKYSYHNSDYIRQDISGDMSLIYRNGPYLIQTGLGVMISEDRGRYMVDYKSYDVVDSYQNVDSLTFDTINGIPVPIYHTSTVYIYDSVNHATCMDKKYSYTYLKIPVLVGYLFEYRRISFTVKTGTEFYLLVKKNEPSIDFINQEIRILGAEKLSPVRSYSHIRWMFACGFAYQVTNRMRISAEPVIGYYLNNLYREEAGHKVYPVSAGFRTGLIWNF